MKKDIEIGKLYKINSGYFANHVALESPGKIILESGLRIISPNSDKLYLILEKVGVGFQSYLPIFRVMIKNKIEYCRIDKTEDDYEEAE